jgi:hypothetical protein
MPLIRSEAREYCIQEARQTVISSSVSSANIPAIPINSGVKIGHPAQTSIKMVEAVPTAILEQKLPLCLRFQYVRITWSCVEDQGLQSRLPVSGDLTLSVALPPVGSIGIEIEVEEFEDCNPFKLLGPLARILHSLWSACRSLVFQARRTSSLVKQR